MTPSPERKVMWLPAYGHGGAVEVEVCDQCAAVVADLEKHQQWHEMLVIGFRL